MSIYHFGKLSRRQYYIFKGLEERYLVMAHVLSSVQDNFPVMSFPRNNLHELHTILLPQ